MRDHKRHTSEMLRAEIQKHPQESRREWMMPVFSWSQENKIQITEVSGSDSNIIIRLGCLQRKCHIKDWSIFTGTL